MMNANKREQRSAGSMSVENAAIDPLIRAVISIGVLVFVAKVFANIFASMRLPPVLGEILAGMIFGPYMLGGAIRVYGHPLVVLNEYVDAFAEVGAIMVLFAAGVSMGYRRLKKVGVWAALIAVGGGALPFVAAYTMYKALGASESTALIVAVAFVATSVAITVRVLEELGCLETDMGMLLVNSAVLDDVVGVILLGVASAALTGGRLDIAAALKHTIAYVTLWLVMLHVAIYVIPRILTPDALSEAKGAVESVAVSIGFIMAALSSALGLSPIVGAYTAGIAVGESKVLARVREFTEHMEIFFGSLFFAVVGAKVDVSLLLREDIALITLVAGLLALVTKTLGAAAPAYLRLKRLRDAICLGIGMAPRGEMGLIVASVALSLGAVTMEVYAETVGMVLITTFLAPLLLSKLCALSSRGACEQLSR